MMNAKNKNSEILYGHRDIVTSCDINPRTFMVTGDKDGKILLWTISNPEASEFPEIKLKNKYKGHLSYVASLNIGQKTGNVFVSCGGDGFLKLWNIEKQSCKTIKPHKNEINFCRMNKNEKYVLSGSQDKHLILYSAKTLAVITKIKGHSKGIWDGDFAPFELMFATSSSDNFVKVWDMKYILDDFKGKNQIGQSKLTSGNPVQSQVKSVKSFKQPRKKMTKDEEGNMLVAQVLKNNSKTSISELIQNTVSESNLDIEKSECLWTLEGHESPVIRVKWINIGLQIISGDSDGVVKLWNYRKASCLFSIHKHQGRIWSLDIFEEHKFENGNITDLIRTQKTENIRILSGDNNSGLFLWKDDTQSCANKALGDRQKRKVIHDELELKMNQNQFREAVTMCFERNMNSWFFKSLQRWQKEFLADWLVESIVFTFDDYCRQLYLNLLNASNLSLREKQFQTELQSLIQELFELDAAHLLSICQSFITHTKYAWTVQIILHCLFGSCIQMGNLSQLYDQLKPKKVDLKRILSVYLNFSEKLLRRNKLQLEVITKIGFDLKKNKLS